MATGQGITSDNKYVADNYVKKPETETVIIKKIVEIPLPAKQRYKKRPKKKRAPRKKKVIHDIVNPVIARDDKGNVIPIIGGIYMIIDPVVYTIFKAKRLGGSKHAYRFQTAGGELIIRKVDADIVHEYDEESYIALSHIALEIKTNKYKFDQAIV